MSNAFPLIPSENRGVLCTCFWVFFERVCAAAGGLSGTERALLFLSASSSFQSSPMCHCTSAHPFPLLRSVLWLLFLCACSSHVSHYFPGISTMLCFHYSLFLFFAFVLSVCPTCCSPSPSLRPSWCLWWTCLHPRNILHSPPSISCLLEPFSSSSSSFLHHQPLHCSLWNPRFVWSDLRNSSFQSEMRFLVSLHQTGWER